MKCIISSLFAAAMCFGGILPPAAHASDPVSYTFGVVPQFDARRTYRVWRPLLDLVEKKTGLHFQLKGSPSIPDFESRFMTGQFDFAYMNPYHFLRASEAQNYHALVRDTGRTLYGVLVVRKDSNIEQVTDLQGLLVAFPAPNALGASLLPRADLETIHHTEIRTQYVQSHSSVYLNVIMGKAAAGGGVQKTLAMQPDSIKENLRVIYKTRESVPHPVVAHPRVPQSVREIVRQAFLEIGETSDGQQLLNAVPIKLIGLASAADYRPLSSWGLDRFYLEQ